MHEASLHAQNCFITCTYDDAHLPQGGSLVKHHFQDFMKRLRIRLDRTTGEKIRFFHCGEYGSQLGRPHHHAIIFGHSFPDRVHLSGEGEMALHVSHSLATDWGKGFCTVGEATFESAAYVARYVTKKVTGAAAEDHYWRLDEATGELVKLEPEYSTMSRGRGIGRGWFEKFSSEVFPSDEVYIRGYLAKPPRYYDQLYDVADPKGSQEVKQRRSALAKSEKWNNSDERLRVREKVCRAKLSLKRRSL